MKGRSLTIAGIFTAIVATVLIIFCDKINLAGVTITCGVMFMCVGILNILFFSFMSKAESGRLLNLITNSAAVLLGICMLVFRIEFEPMVTFMLGLFVGVCALWQFFVLAIGARPFQLPAWLYLFPVFLVAGSVSLFFCRQQRQDTMLMLITGISLAVMAVGCICEGSALGYARRKREKETANADGIHSATEAAADIAESSSEANARPSDSSEKTETTDDLDDEIVGRK